MRLSEVWRGATERHGWVGPRSPPPFLPRLFEGCRIDGNDSQIHKLRRGER